MRLDGLQELCRSMARQDIGRYKFRYQVNQLIFECIFFRDIQPFELIMGCLNHDRLTLLFEVKPGFKVIPFIECKQTLSTLIEALKTSGDTQHKFSLTEFLREFDKHIPHQAQPRNVATPRDVVRHYPQIEEALKIHFYGWRDNTIQNDHVTAFNLDKTRRLLGQEVYEFCKRHNISSKWTYDENRAVNFYHPQDR